MWCPFIDPSQLKESLERKSLPGIYLWEIFFQPTFHKWHNEVCGGLQIHITDPDAYKPYVTSLAIIQEVRALYPLLFPGEIPPMNTKRKRCPSTS